MQRARYLLKKRVLFLVSALGVLGLHLAIAWQPLNRLEGFRLLYSNGPLIDDSYIFFKMSRDLADWFAGCLPSLQLSSGFQPLIVLMYCPIFHFFGDQKELAVHLALSLNAFLGFSASLLLYALLCRIASHRTSTLLVSIWIWSPYVMNQTVNGMETPLALLLLLFIYNYYLHIKGLNTARVVHWFLLGCCIGIGFWARVDMGLAGLAIALDQLWLTIQNRNASAAVRRRIYNVLTCGITALVVAAPWMLFTIMATDNVVPVSGKAVWQITKVFFDTTSAEQPNFLSLMFDFFRKEFVLFQPFAALSWSTTLQFCCMGLWLAGLILCFRDYQWRSTVLPGFIFQVLLFAAYLLAVGGFWHLNRYFFPLYTLMLFQYAVLLNYCERCIRVRKTIYQLMLLTVFVGYFWWYGLQYYDFFKTDVPARYLSNALYVKSKIPAQARVGAFQSGCLSYFLDNHVINLDGVTSEDAYMHLKHKTMDSYLEQQEIDYIVEEEYLFDMWNNYLAGQLLERYTQVAVRTNIFLPSLWQRLGIYKRRP